MHVLFRNNTHLLIHLQTIHTYLVSVGKTEIETAAFVPLAPYTKAAPYTEARHRDGNATFGFASL